MAEIKTETRSLRDLKTAAALAGKRKELDNLRSRDVRDWTLNRAFYRGNQWAFWNKSANRLESLPVDDGDKPRFKVRLVSNQILPGVNHYVAQLTKTKPVILATPDSGADRDIKAAQVGQSLYDTLWGDLGLTSKLHSALVHATLSQGYWSLRWDPLAGKSMRVMVGPDGQIITDQELADIFREELTQAQVPVEEFEQTVYVGEIRVDALGGEQVYLDPTPSNFEDCTYAICQHAMDPDEIFARFKKRVEPDSSPSDLEIALPGTERKDKQENVTRTVYIMYVRPCPAVPKGRVVAWVEGPDEILAEAEWPYPFNELPLIKFPGVERPGAVYDEALVTHVRPLNKELNRTLSQIVEHKNLTLKPQMIAPVGSLRQRLTSEPGAVFEYQPIQGLAPDWRPIPNLPAYVFEHLANIQQRIDVLFNRMPSERGSLPARVDAGYTVELIQEAVADQLSPVIQRLEYSLAKAGDMIAKLAQRYYIEPRLLRIKGAGSSVQVKKFMQADLAGGFSFHAEAGSGLPRTRAGRQQQIKDLMEMQLIDARTAMKHLDVANLSGIQAQMAADEEQAYREHEKLLKGEIVNGSAVQQAMGAVNQGINPQTGEPLQSPEEAQAILMQASVSPLEYENAPAHAEVHRLYMTSVEFESLPPEIQGRFIQHFVLTMQKIQQSQPVPDNVKTTLSLKGTVGPTGAAAIMNRSGIPEITPDIMSEPPLETSVYDSIDKPDMDDAGNDPLTSTEQLMSMQQAEEEHGLKMAKAAHEVALARKRADQSDFRPRNSGRES